jgi:hypothetical protein
MVTVEQAIAALSMPPDVRVDLRVPRTQLTAHGAPTRADERILAQGLDELFWVASLRPDRIAVPALRDDAREYLEVVVFTARLRPAAKVARIVELIHRSIPYPLVLVVEHADRVLLSLAHKRASAAERERVVLDGEVLDGPLSDDAIGGAFLAALSVAGLPRNDLFALYQGLIERLQALLVGRLTGAFALPATPASVDLRRDGLRRYDAVAREVASMRRLGLREKQVQRRVELSIGIRRLEGDLEGIVAAMRE